MKTVIIGNFIAFIAAIIMVISGYVKSKQATLFLQIIETLFDALACFVLGAISGGIVSLFSVIRSALAYKDKFNVSIKCLIIISVAYFSIAFNQNSWIGYLPLLAFIIYTIFIDKTEKEKFKILTIVSLSLWVIHDFVMKAYISVVFDIGSIVTSLIAVYRIRKE